MTVSAAKPEEKRLGWFVPTAVDQAESCVKPAAEGRNLARMPNPQHSETERLDHGPNWLKHTEDGLLLGECRSKRLYVFDPRNSPKELRGLLGGKIREGLITSNWPDILRIAATMTAGTIAPSQILRKLASYPRQNDLAAALREIGRVERTLFMIDWILDADMQRRAQIGLNKGESHHALKNALRIGRQGEIRDRTTEGQHYRMAGLNLLTAIVIYWNTVRLGEAVNQRKRAGLPTPPELLAHTSPLGWAHILLTGEYRWSKKR